MNDKRPDLRDCTFVIPFHKDSEDRLKNLYCIVEYIQRSFYTHIVLVESYTDHTYARPLAFTGDGMNYISVKQEGPIFHRTKIINAGLKEVSTPFASIYDTDCVFPIEQIMDALATLRAGASMAYPYGGDFVDIERSYIDDGIIKERESFTKESVGGAVFLNLKEYKSAGLENENLIGWAPEDAERYHRMMMLRHKIARVPGKCLHITHSRGINSSAMNPHTQENLREFLKVKSMDSIQLWEYIKTWNW